MFTSLRRLMASASRFSMTAVTGKDNQTVDMHRVCLGTLVLALVGLEAYALYRGQRFDAEAFCFGASALLAGSGAGIALKAKTEPDPGAGSN